MQKSKYANGKPITRLATVSEATARYRMCRNLLMQIAEAEGAVKRITPRCVRIDIVKMDAAIEKY